MRSIGASLTALGTFVVYEVLAFTHRLCRAGSFLLSGRVNGA